MTDVGPASERDGSTRRVLSEEAAKCRDVSLWSRWREGDPLAGEALLSHYDSALAQLLRRLGASNRADLDECYGELVLQLTRYKDRRELSSSFYGLARRMAIGIVTRRRQRDVRWQNLDRPELESASHQPAVERIAFLEALDQCLAKLTHPLEREVFQQRILLEVENRDLARRLGKSPNHVAVLLYGALRQMRTCLERSGYSA